MHLGMIFDVTVRRVSVSLDTSRLAATRETPEMTPAR